MKIKVEAGLCENCGKPFDIKMGRFGKFLACTGYPDCKTIKAIPKKGTEGSTKTTKKSAKKTTKKATKKKTTKK